MTLLPVTLTGRIVCLEPLSLSHVPDLVIAGNHEEIWRYMLYGDVRTEAQMRQWVEELLEWQARGTDLPFAVILQESKRAIGASRYLNINMDHRQLEIGGTWYDPAYWGSGVNTESKLLLLSHAFDHLGCLRVQFKTDLRNIRSQQAIERLGATREGVLRKHMITPEGYVRDSVYYSIVDNEWPEVKQRLLQKLEPHLTTRS